MILKSIIPRSPLADSRRGLYCRGMTETETTQGMALPADIAALTFEEAMSELEKLVRQLEDGRAKLDEAIGAYERGALLRRHCEAKLREAEARIEKIAVTDDGAIDAIPF